MKIEDILQALPTREDLASAIGIERRSAAPGEMLSALGTGILLGAALAVLFAPKSGKDLRHDLGDRLSEKIGDLGEQFHASSSPNAPTASDETPA